MVTSLLALTLALGAATTNGLQVWQDGKEYIYSKESAVHVGTSDYESNMAGFIEKATVKIQVSGDTLKVNAYDLKKALFNKDYPEHTWPYSSNRQQNKHFEDHDETIKYFTPEGYRDASFSFNLDHGLVQQIQIPSGTPVWLGNMMRAFASTLQLDLDHLSTESQFTAREKNLQGDCFVQYTLEQNHNVDYKVVTKAVSHLKDCVNRRYRLFQNMEGVTCNADPTMERKFMKVLREPEHSSDYASAMLQAYTPTEPLFSESTTTFLLVPTDGDNYKIQKLVSFGNIIVQPFGEEGASHSTIANTTMILKEVRNSADDINVSSAETYDNVEFAFENGDWSWDKNFDLKERDNFFVTGYHVEESQETFQQGLKRKIESFVHEMEEYKLHYHTQDEIQKYHKEGLAHIFPFFYPLNYESLKTLKDLYVTKTGQSGIFEKNVFFEVLAMAGTNPAAVLIQEMALANEFDSDKDTARFITEVPFNIRKPSKQLVKLYERLIENLNNYQPLTKMAIPLAFAHLVRRTCELATPHPFQIQENGNNKYAHLKRECLNEFLNPYVEEAFRRFNSLSEDQHEEMDQLLMIMYNFRWGKTLELLKPIVQGQTKHKDYYSVRTLAIFAVSPMALASGQEREVFLPVFVDRNENHEVRIAAFDILMRGSVDSTIMSKIVKLMVYEKDNEVFNYVYTAFEKFATKDEGSSPCNPHQKEYATYFLKYLRQYLWTRPSYGFGISKTYGKTFTKDKYGYSGSFDVHTVGSHKSTSPLAIMFDVRSQHFGHHTMQLFGGYIKMKGLAQKLVEKLRHFTYFNPDQWKVDELKEILFNQMQIREKPLEPVEIDVIFMARDNVVFHRYYSEESVNPGGNLFNFFMDIYSLGQQYNINNQQGTNFGTIVYEQPTEVGTPMAYMAGVTFMGSFQAQISRGQDSGAFVRKMDYKIQLHTQAINSMVVFDHGQKNAFYINQDRVYNHKFGSKLTGMINLPKHQLRLTVERPEYGEPMSIMMHSKTMMGVWSTKMTNSPHALLKESCPRCETEYTITKGVDKKVDRYFLNSDNEEFGFHVEGKYFDCEAQEAKSSGEMWNVIAQAFNPMSKEPKDITTALTMGLRQVNAFLLYYPRVESCGVGFHWSQSKFNPVEKVELIFTGQMKKKYDPKSFFQGKKFAVDGTITFHGTVDRVHHLSAKYEFEPLMSKTEFAFKLVRNPFRMNAVDYPAYSLCADYHARYPVDPQNPFNMDYDTNQQVKGDLSLSWGKHASCGNNPGKIQIIGEHETTKEARDFLKTKWYYKTCRSQMESNEWKNSKFALTDACYFMAVDLYTLNHFKYTANFHSLEPWMITAYRKVETLAKTGLFPFWQIELDNSLAKQSDFLYSTDEVHSYSPVLNVEQVFHPEKETFDMFLQTNRDKNVFKGINYGFWNWNAEPYLQLTSYEGSSLTLPRSSHVSFTQLFLKKNHFISDCTATTKSIHTYDNVTYPYQMHNCYTLVSAHCAPTPTYAVFMKKSAKFAKDTIPKMDAKIFVGGYEIDIKPVTHAKYEVTIEGQTIGVGEHETYYYPTNQKFSDSHQEPDYYKFKIHRLDKDYVIDSFMNFQFYFDGNSIRVSVPGYVKGHHCGMCGDYNGDHEHELIHPQMCEMKTGQDMAAAWVWEHNDSNCPARPTCQYTDSLFAARQTR